jgi:hypothetical protein
MGVLGVGFWMGVLGFGVLKVFDGEVLVDWRLVFWRNLQ